MTLVLGYFNLQRSTQTLRAVVATIRNLYRGRKKTVDNRVVNEMLGYASANEAQLALHNYICSLTYSIYHDVLSGWWIVASSYSRGLCRSTPTSMLI